MPQISISVVNGTLVRSGLQNLAKDIPDIGRMQIYKTAQNIQNIMKVYPPPKPTSKRTGRLRASVKTIKTDKGYTVEIDPVAKGRHYGKYVVGDARGGSQAWMHIGWWHMFADVVEEEVAKLPPEIEEHIKRASKGYGIA
jgi:hypothetical protein